MIQKLRYTILFLLLIPFLTAFAQTAPKYEIRAAWLTTLGGMDWPSAKAVSASGIKKQQEELCHILDELQQANFNTVLFQTRLRGDVIYPSQFEPFAESLTGTEGKNPGYDPLRFAIEECHKRGMELHAWIVAIPIGNTRQVRTLGKNALTRKHPSLCKQFNGSWYLDPGNPETDDYLANIVREIVSGYDVDGIHLDYIRYPEQGERFPDQSTYRKYGKKQDLKQWRRNNITRIVRRIYTETKSLKPWVKVSSSPIGKYRDTGRYSSRGWNAYEEVYQDAQQWLKEGIHDALFPMMYFQGNHFYPFALDWKENAYGRWIVPGLGIYFLHPKEQDWQLDEVIRQIYFIRSIGLDGQAYFRTRFLLDNTKSVFDELRQHFYPLPALVPPMTWTDSIAPAKPQEPSFTLLDRGIRFRWEASTDNLSPVYYRLYASDTYPVDTRNPLNLIAPRIEDTRYTYVPEVPWQEYLYWAVTAVDRCGNESEPLEFFQLTNYE